MTDNREWLASLSDKALNDEIKYGRILCDDNKPNSHHQRAVEEALAEKRRRDATCK